MDKPALQDNLKSEVPSAELVGGVISPTRFWAFLCRFISGKALFNGPILRHHEAVWSSLPKESVDHLVDKDPVFLKALNPHSTEWIVLPLRLGFIGLVYFICYFITFGPLSITIWHIAAAAIVAPILLRVLLLFSERVLNNQDIENIARGQYPMVVWLCFTFYIDCVYTVVKAKVLLIGDARKTKQIREAAEVFDERTNAKYAADGRFYFDFVADTGDGFNATYTVANLMGRKNLTINERREDGSVVQNTIPRAQVVVHGGDICYPITNFINLYYRFVQPYSWAFPKSSGNGEKMYLAAGNHEYLDGLEGFRNILLPFQHIGGWLTPQRGSYFAITLPYGWVMFVLDIGPEPEDIDEHQLEYFKSIELDDDDRLIMVYHVPDWIKCGHLDFSNMKRVQAWRKELGSKLRLVLAGDLHYYKRMELGEENEEIVQVVDEASPNCFTTSKRQYIVAGHGGAFAHATHFPMLEQMPLVEDNETETKTQHLKTVMDYPSLEQSRNLWGHKGPRMFITTPTHIYSRVIAALYMVAFMNIYPATYTTGSVTFEVLVEATVSGAFFYIVAAWFFVTHTILVVANQQVKLHNIHKVLLLVILHTAAHIAFAFLFRYAVDLGLFAAAINQDLSEDGVVFGYCLSANLLMYTLGTLFGPLVSTLYFWFAVHLLDWHYNESFGIIAVDAYRGFCRFAINQSGDVDLYTIVSDVSPKEWFITERTQEKPAYLDSKKLAYHLLERVTITKDEL